MLFRSFADNYIWHAKPVLKKRLSVPNIIIRKGILKYGDQKSPDGFFINSNFTNASVYKLDTVVVSAIVFDKTHQVIAVTQYVANTVKPRETRDYQMFWPLPIAANVLGQPEIIIDANPFDPNNLK